MQSSRHATVSPSIGPVSALPTGNTTSTLANSKVMMIALVPSSLMCICTKAEFSRLLEENASAPPAERLSHADLLIDPGYEEMLDMQGKALCEEVSHFPDNASCLLTNTVHRFMSGRKQKLREIPARCRYSQQYNKGRPRSEHPM